MIFDFFSSCVVKRVRALHKKECWSLSWEEAVIVFDHHGWGSLFLESECCQMCLTWTMYTETKEGLLNVNQPVQRERK